MVDPAAQDVVAGLSQLLHILGHGGQRWIGVGGDGDIVKAHDAHISRHLDASGPQGCYEAHGNQIAGAEENLRQGSAAVQTAAEPCRRFSSAPAT